MDQRILNFAEVLVHYSIEAQKGEEILVSGSYEARQLIYAIYEELLKTGSYPRLKVLIPGIEYLFYKHAQDHQLDFVSDIDYLEAERISALIGIRSESNINELRSINPARISRMQKSRDPLQKKIINKERWNITLFPTRAYAQAAEMSLTEYEDFVYSAVYADQDDPIKCWKKLSEEQQKLCTYFNKGSEIRITGNDTDITMSVKGRKFINSDGKRNMPSGEIYTAPVEGSVNGHITYEFPVCFMGQEVNGVKLELKDGKIVQYSAQKNEEFLKAMLNTDEGARIIGELGIGNNFGIDRFTKNILFDEKIGGTIHLAVGNSYPECGGLNRSSIHWDMIKDLRDGGEVYLDGELVQKDGKFLF